MDNLNWKEAFGPTPDAFRNLVENALEAPPEKRSRPRLSPVLAGFGILIFCTSLALIARFNLREWPIYQDQVVTAPDRGYAKWMPYLAARETDQLIALVTKGAAFDGNYFASCQVFLKEGEGGLLLPADGKTLPERVHNPEGLPLYFIRAQLSEGGTDSPQYTADADGDLGIHFTGKTQNEGETLFAILLEIAVNPEGAMDTWSFQEMTLAVALPVDEALAVSALEGPQEIPNTGITVTAGSLSLTGERIYFSFALYYSPNENETGLAPGDLESTLRFMRESDAALMPFSFTPTMVKNPKGEGTYYYRGALEVADMPGALIAEFVDIRRNRPLSRTVLPLTLREDSPASPLPSGENMPATPSGEATPAGSYTIGVDMPPGLYTYHLSEGAEGTLRVIDKSGTFYRAYYIKGEALYAMYLSEGATVVVPGEGVFTPMESVSILSGTTAMTYEGTGRFLAGVQIPEGMLKVRPLSGTAGRAGYRVTSMAAEEGQEPLGELIPIPEGESAEVTLRYGDFLEFIDCQLEGRG